MTHVTLILYFSGFMVNLCTVALQLCESFLLSKGKEKYKQIEARYCTAKGCRLRFDNERTLGGGHIGKWKLWIILNYLLTVGNVFISVSEVFFWLSIGWQKLWFWIDLLRVGRGEPLRMIFKNLQSSCTSLRSSRVSNRLVSHHVVIFRYLCSMQ